MGMLVMMPSDTYHNFIQAHIAFTLYFPLPFWLLTASSRLKFYLKGSILTWGENIALSAICLIVYITAGGGLWPRAKSPASRVWEISRARQQPLQRCENPCWTAKSESGRESQWNLSPHIKAEPEAFGQNEGRKENKGPLSCHTSES